MSSTISYHCTSSPMEEPRTETSWSECFQDLASWCHQPQDELTNTSNVANQSEFKDSFDDQSMYNWEANSSSVDLKGDMWKPQSDSLSLQYPNEQDDNKDSLIQLMSDNQGASDGSIRYSCNMVLTPGIDQDMDSCQDDIKTFNWNEIAPLPSPNISKSFNTILAKKQNIPLKEGKSRANAPKPPLKLDIAAATTKAPTASELSTNAMPINTPEVLSILGDPTFDIFNYLDSYDDQSLLAVDPNSIISQRPKESLATSSYQPVIKIDHDYTEAIPVSEPITPKTASTVSRENKAPPSVLDDEDIKPFLPVKEEPSSPAPSTSTSLGKRIRKTMADEDYIYGEEPSSDNSTDWSPTVKKRTKTVKKKRAEVSRTRSSSFSDSGSVTSGNGGKYRELRDRNNEASRRSRMNRKQKEVEMMDRANTLQRENEVLRVKAESLEKRVKSLRQILLQRVLEKK